MIETLEHDQIGSRTVGGRAEDSKNAEILLFPTPMLNNQATSLGIDLQISTASANFRRSFSLLSSATREFIATRPLHIRSFSSSVSRIPVVRAMSIEDDEHVELLQGVNDDHGGVILEMKDTMEPNKFVSSLQQSMLNWRHQGKKGIWIKLPIELANLVPLVVEEGFLYHHAEPTYLMLVYWIPETPNSLPVNATHRVGVGAFVLNDKREVLAVQEKGGKFRGTGIWKFPTGVLEQGEDIFNGAIREVKEETGIDTEFVEVLAFRQSHKIFFEKSDLFFVCLLSPLTFDLQKQESEIEDVQWIPIEEFQAQPFVQRHELVKYIIKVGLAKFDKDYAGFSPVSISSAFSKKSSCLYLNHAEMKTRTNRSKY